MNAESDNPEATFQQQLVLHGHSKAVSSVKYCPKNPSIAVSSSADQSIRVWNLEKGSEALQLKGHNHGISDVSWNRQGNYLCSASDDCTLKLWDVETGKSLKTLTGHTNYVFCCNFDPQSHMLASGSFDEVLRVWDVRSGRCIREVPAHSDPVTAVHFNHDGTLIVTSSLDGLCRVWDTQSGHCLKTLFEKESPPVSHVRFTPNSRYVLASALDNKLRLWDFERGRCVKTYRGHTNTLYCLFSSFFRSGGRSWVVSGSEDGSVFMWDTNSRKVVAKIPPGADPSSGHTAAVLGLDCHPSAPQIITAAHDSDNSIRVWNMSTDQ